jgi:hypothetical protein
MILAVSPWRICALLIGAGTAVAPIATAHADFSLNKPTRVALSASTGGATANVTFTGAGSNVLVAMRYDEANPAIDPAVGFVIYQDANAVLNQPASNGSRGVVSSSLFAAPGLHYGVQLYNYAPAFNTTAHLLVSDLSQAPAVSASVGTERGPLLRDQSAIEHLVGVGGGGAFHNYSFAGDGQPVSFVLNTRRRDPITDAAIGLAVWDQWGNPQQDVTPQQAVSPSGAIVWTLMSRAGVGYGVQVFNYEPGVAMTYVLAAL